MPVARKATAAAAAAAAAAAGEPTALAARSALATLRAFPFAKAAVAVTGANGYFGHRMVLSLLATGVPRVVAIDRVHTRVWADARVHTVTADVRDRAAIIAAFADIHAVVHVASFFGMPPFGTIRDSGEWAVNADGTHIVVQAALAANVRSLVYISSSSAIVSGTHELVDVDETQPYPEAYLDFYGPAKAAAERHVLAANGTGTLPLRTTVIRPSGIFGEDELLHVPRLLATVDSMGGVLPFYFAGEPLSDWTHAENLAWGIYLCLDQLELSRGGRAAGQIFHITDGEALSARARGGGRREKPPGGGGGERT